MKKVLFAALLFTGLAACNNDGKITVDVDSLGKEADTLGNKIGNKAEQVWDSTKAKAKDLKEKLDNKLDRADSVDVDVDVDTTRRK